VSGTGIGVNSIILLGSETARRALSFIVIFLIGRALSVEDFGIFRLANSFLIIFLVLSNFGLNPMVTRHVASGRKDEAQLIGNIRGLKLVLGVVVFSLTVLFAAGLGYEKRTLNAIVLMVLAIPAASLASTHSA